jgi:hypothetical protein
MWPMDDQDGEFADKMRGIMATASVAKRVTVAFVHYKTPDLLETAVRSFKSFYRDVPTMIFDNGSGETSANLIHHLVEEYAPCLEAVFSGRNLYHGPAIDRVMHQITTEFVFFMDTDTQTLRGGFLEAMCDVFDSSDRIYGVSRVGTLNRWGFLSAGGTPVLASCYMMIRTRDYNLFPAFEHHGQPGLRHFGAAVAEGYELREFPVNEYVHHLGRGTAMRYGYGLGLKSKVEFLLNKLGL